MATDTQWHMSKPSTMVQFISKDVRSMRGDTEDGELVVSSQLQESSRRPWHEPEQLQQVCKVIQEMDTANGDPGHGHHAKMGALHPLRGRRHEDPCGISGSSTNLPRSRGTAVKTKMWKYVYNQRGTRGNLGKQKLVDSGTWKTPQHPDV